VKEYDIFLPLFYNDGSPIESRKYQELQELLLEQFDGLTYFPQPNQGYWRFGDITYRDEIVIYRVISQDSSASREYLGKLKERLKREFQQHEILIIEREIGLL